MSILDQSIRSLDSCDEALEEQDPVELHRVCSRDTLDGSDSIIDQNPVCYSTDNLVAMSSSVSLMRMCSEVGVEEDRVSCERMMSYEVNNFSDSEDDDDVYVPEWQIYGDFKAGVLEDQRAEDVLPFGHSLTVWMKSQDLTGVAEQLQDGEAEGDAAQQDEEKEEEDPETREKRLRRKRHYRLGHISSDLEDLVKQLEVVPAKMRRMDGGGGGC